MICKECNCKHFMDVKFKYDKTHKIYCLINSDVFKNLAVGNYERESSYEYPDIIECSQLETREEGK